MPSEAPPSIDLSAVPETADLLLNTFAEFYRQEVGAEEDIHRTLPFFGTALGIVIGALAYAAGRLPRWPDQATSGGDVAYLAAGILLGLAILEAVFVLVWLSRAIARRDYKRIGPEIELRDRFEALQVYYDEMGVTGERLDRDLARDMRQVLLDTYTAVTPANRELNQRRYRFRALAASHLVRSLIWALTATSVIFVADKLGYLPKVMP